MSRQEEKKERKTANNNDIHHITCRNKAQGNTLKSVKHRMGMGEMGEKVQCKEV
jgi:hypothetical protein